MRRLGVLSMSSTCIKECLKCFNAHCVNGALYLAYIMSKTTTVHTETLWFKHLHFCLGFTLWPSSYCIQESLLNGEEKASTKRSSCPIRGIQTRWCVCPIRGITPYGVCVGEGCPHVNTHRHMSPVHPVCLCSVLLLPVPDSRPATAKPKHSEWTLKNWNLTWWEIWLAFCHCQYRFNQSLPIGIGLQLCCESSLKPAGVWRSCLSVDQDPWVDG